LKMAKASLPWPSKGCTSIVCANDVESGRERLTEAGEASSVKRRGRPRSSRDAHGDGAGIMLQKDVCVCVCVFVFCLCVCA
jgi:hypothetical protein